MIIAIILLLIISSFSVSLIYGKIKTLKWIMLLFVTWFVLINSFFFINENIYFIGVAFAFPFIALVLKIVYDFLIKKMTPPNKEQIKNRILFIVLVSIVFLAIFTFRLWINKFNGDAIYYANISKVIQQGNTPNVSSAYKLVSYYYISALAENPIDMYTIAGDFIQHFVLAFALIIIINEKTKNKILLTIFSIMAGILYSASVTYAISSLNWSIVPLVFIVMLAFGIDEWLWLLITPIAFSLFSISATLMFPCAMLVLLFKKKIDLKEMTVYASICLLGVYILIAGMFNISKSVNITMLVFIVPTLLAPYIKSDFEIKNFIYKIPEIIQEKPRKVFVVTASIVLLLIVSFLKIRFDILHSSGVDIVLQISTLFVWTSLISIFIYQFLKEEKISDLTKILMAFICIQFAYYILVAATNKVPWYIHRRVMFPILFVTPVLVFLELTQYLRKPKGASSAFIAILAILGINFSARIASEYEHQKYIRSFNNTIDKQYYWITPEEKNDIIKITNKFKGKAFSDLPLNLLSNINTLITINNRNNYFYGMAAGMGVYAKSKIFDKKDKSLVSIDVRLTIEYAQHFNDWTYMDKAELFIFRNEKYANIVQQHYKNMKLEKQGSLFLLHR